MTVEELIAELGVTVDPAKAGVLKTWNDKFSAMETDSQTKLADAQKQLQDAQGLQRVIDDSIRNLALPKRTLFSCRRTTLLLLQLSALGMLQSMRSRRLDSLV